MDLIAANPPHHLNRCSVQRWIFEILREKWAK
jgi:hypothetical protein